MRRFVSWENLWIETILKHGFLVKYILKFKYYQSQEDHPLFIKHFLHKKINPLIVYIDDIVTKSNDMEEIKNLKNLLAKEFEIKDLTTSWCFLGMEVAKSNKEIFVSQRNYFFICLIRPKWWVVN